jgi:hypothetical protein
VGASGKAGVSPRPLTLKAHHHPLLVPRVGEGITITVFEGMAVDWDAVEDGSTGEGPVHPGGFDATGLGHLPMAPLAQLDPS